MLRFTRNYFFIFSIAFIGLSLIFLTDSIVYADKTSYQKKIAEFVKAAKKQIGVTVSYNPAYQVITYPMGDIPLHEGVCTDVIVRAFRGINIDLQKEIHEHMKKYWSIYPKKWGLKSPDKNIDHRRVPNLEIFFKSKNMKLPLDSQEKTYLPGDVVVWVLDNGLIHIGILSDKMVSDENTHPMVIHNIGYGAVEEDILYRYKIVGHYRLNNELFKAKVSWFYDIHPSHVLSHHLSVK